MRRMVCRRAVVLGDLHAIMLGRKGIEIESRADTDDKKHRGGRRQSDPSRIDRRASESGRLGARGRVQSGIADGSQDFLSELLPQLAAGQSTEGGAIGLQMLNEDPSLGRLLQQAR